ncbi:hypothetical protein IEQ34_007144 [Dendrobium chrysotoxum]|uniref:Uncharacterized protein n=1 Tax=Dendrobium chrysotoxum TaxID=161865 RepID=A0AAV7HA43_DENCH|nr:hypothetical protein IEQ34_007144 [Dendrobium chrysotoxum]
MGYIYGLDYAERTDQPQGGIRGFGSDLRVWRRLQGQDPLCGKSSGIDCKYLKVLQPLDFNSVSRSKKAWNKETEEDKHLMMFHKLKHWLFKRVVEPYVAEDWLLRIEIICDSIWYPEKRKVPLIVFLVEGQTERG